MKKILFLLLTFLCLEKQIIAQSLPQLQRNKTIDSLELYLLKVTVDTFKVKSLLKITDAYTEENNFVKAKEKVNEALNLSKKIKFSTGQANCYFENGIIYAEEGSYLNALKNYLAAIKIFELAKDMHNVANCNNNIGVIYFKLQNYKEALKNHKAALEIRKLLNDRLDMAKSYNYIAETYNCQKKNDLALTYYIYSFNINKELNNKAGMIEGYNNIGTNFRELGYYGAAFNYYISALALCRHIGNKNDLAATYGYIGETYMLNNFPDKARKYIDSALNTALDIRNNELIRDEYKNLTELDSLTHKWEEAYKHHKEFIVYRDKIINEENTKNAVFVQMQYEYSKKEATTKLEQEKKDVLVRDVYLRQRLQRNALLIAFFLMIILAGVSYISLRIKRKDNLIISEQKLDVEHKNHEITQSIQYAKRIQDTILPSDKLIRLKIF